MFLKQIKKNQSGLSLIEVMTVVGIMVTINTIVVLSNRSVNAARNVEMSAYKLASDIRKMQSYTLNLQNFRTGVYPDGGWGVFVNSSSEYRTFADGHSSTLDHRATANEFDELFLMPNQTMIKSIEIFDGTSTTTSSVLHLTYEPPDPATHICNNVNCNGIRADIILSTDKGGSEQHVVVNQFGLIDVEH